jgi:hypothetical protein
MTIIQHGQIYTIKKRNFSNFFQNNLLPSDENSPQKIIHCNHLHSSQQTPQLLTREVGYIDDVLCHHNSCTTIHLGFDGWWTYVVGNWNPAETMRNCSMQQMDPVFSFFFLFGGWHNWTIFWQRLKLSAWP